jgi:hypothetical protein
MWTAGSGSSVSNNYGSFFNYTVYEAGYGSIPQLFGNSSLAITSTNNGNVEATLNAASALNSIPNNPNTNVDCSGSTGFTNLTMILQQVSPSAAPQSATVTLYSLNTANYYTYDLTSILSNMTANGLWNNYTIQVGPNADGMDRHRFPNVEQITSMKVQFTYPADSNVSLNIGALFFGGHTKL